MRAADAATHAAGVPLVWRRFRGIECSLARAAGFKFARHAHAEFVLSTTLYGVERLKLGAQVLEAGPGELTLTQPWQEQASECPSGPWSFVSLYLEPDALAAWRGDNVFVTTRRCVTQRVPHLTAELAKVVRHMLFDAVTDEEALEATLGVVAAFDELHPHGASVRRNDAHERRALSRMQERLLLDEGPTSVAALGSAVGLTAVQAVRVFRRQLGLTPMAWRVQVRLRRAKREIEAGKPLKEVAADLGFADQSHLCRRFRAAFGLTPGQWAKAEMTFKT
jgi:AraC family transcriptional regulator, chemosensory pili system protein ChpD